MNEECEGQAVWSYDRFDYSHEEVYIIRSGCRHKFGTCNNCEKNIETYIHACQEYRKKMNMIISIEKLEIIRLDLLKQAEDISCIINQMRASME